MEPVQSSAATWDCAQVKAAPCHLQLIVPRGHGSKGHKGSCSYLVSEVLRSLISAEEFLKQFFFPLYSPPVPSLHPTLASPPWLSVCDADLRVPLRPR